MYISHFGLIKPGGYIIFIESYAPDVTTRARLFSNSTANEVSILHRFMCLSSRFRDFIFLVTSIDIHDFLRHFQHVSCVSVLN